LVERFVTCLRRRNLGILFAGLARGRRGKTLVETPRSHKKLAGFAARFAAGFASPLHARVA
jgi:hypothetical protein